MTYRFEMTEQESAAVYTHAKLAAALLGALVERREHYDGIVATMREQDGADPIDRKLMGQWNSVAAQLRAAASDVALLAEEAKAQGPEVLQNLRDPTPKIDKTLSAPPPGDALMKLATAHTMAVALTHAALNAAEQLQRLTQAMSTATNPGLLAFASELDRLASQLRPPEMPPGPYAPFAKPKVPNN